MEILVCFVLVVSSAGKRGVAFDYFGERADVVTIMAAAVAITLLHLFVTKRLLAKLDNRFPNRAYDERRILFDLGQAARGATNINQVYELVIKEIGAALRTTNVSIFVRDDASGDYVPRVSTKEIINPQQGESAAVETRSALEHQVLASDALIVKRLRGLGAGLSMTPGDLDTWMRAAATLTPSRRLQRERECATLRLIDARFLLGITMQDRLVGILSLGGRTSARPYTTADKQMLVAVASQLAFIIENAKLVERMVAEEGLRRELKLASEVQQRLLPECAPQSDAFELSAFCQPARGVGGDYYDFIELCQGQTAFVVADVAGKGIAAALLMSSVQASLRSQAMTSCGNGNDRNQPADLVRTMNRLLHASTGAASYVTFFYAQFDETARTLTYVNAGHNPPFIIRTKNAPASRAAGKTKAELSLKDFASRRQSGAAFACPNGACVAVLESGEDDYTTEEFLHESRIEVIELTTGGAVLGFFEDCLYEQETVQMEQGDLLVAYTDGLTEALNVDGEEFGEENLRAMLTGLSHESADDVRGEIVNRVRAWSAGVAAQHDDLTFVVFKVK
jgi:sigma-B regulation protein RsbU (phosphoserine phosphatase)